MDTYIFKVKNKKPTKIKAESHIKACEQFKENNPDFKLQDLIDIEHKENKKSKHKDWLKHRNKHKRTGD